MSFGNNSIEQNIEAVDLTTAFIKAVGNENYQNLLALINWLKTKGYEEPVLYGGALRDIYIGQFNPKDYDFEVTGSQHMMKIDPAFLLDISVRKYKMFSSKADERALRADAPINGIAMNEEGKIFAHPLFEEHASMGIYATRQDLNEKGKKVSRERFFQLRRKYPHWTLDG